MAKQWKFAIIGIFLFVVLAAIIFKPQISRILEGQYVQWQLERLDADRYQVTAMPTMYHVLINKDKHRFVFFYTGTSDISRRVTSANSFLSKWPDNKSQCENSGLGREEVCLIAGSSAVLKQ